MKWFSKVVLAVIAIVLVLSVTIFLREKEVSQEPSAVLSIRGNVIRLMVADSPEERSRGLSRRTNLAENEGMLFVFDTPDYHSFWMKDMKFPLDIIFIRDDRIVAVYENVLPPNSEQETPSVVKPDEKANFVLEINAGQSSLYGFQKGDKVFLKRP